jgi:hypothetical protein
MLHEYNAKMKIVRNGFPEVRSVKQFTSRLRSSENLTSSRRVSAWRYACTLKLAPGHSTSACDANSRPDKKLVTIMSLPVRSCLCRRHSERFGGPFGPRQWLRLLRRSTCSKRGSVRTVFFFKYYIFFGDRSLYHSRLNSVKKNTRSRETRVKRVLGASRYMYDSEIEFV